MSKFFHDAAPPAFTSLPDEFSQGFHSALFDSVSRYQGIKRTFLSGPWQRTQSIPVFHFYLTSDLSKPY
jgi:hypothetical protein